MIFSKEGTIIEGSQVIPQGFFGSSGRVSAHGLLGGVLFENCTVDASIFVVSNEERTVDALAPGADEGRRRLR